MKILKLVDTEISCKFQNFKSMNIKEIEFSLFLKYL